MVGRVARVVQTGEMGEGAFMLSLARCRRRPCDEDDGLGRREVVRSRDALGGVDQVLGHSEVAAIGGDGGVGGEGGGMPERLVGLAAQPGPLLGRGHRGRPAPAA